MKKRAFRNPLDSRDMTDLFKNNLTRFRADNEMTQEDLAKACGVHRNTISRWEAGDPSVSLDALMKIAEAFKTDPIYLLMKSYEREIFSKLNGEIQKIIDGAITHPDRFGRKKE